MYNLSIGYVCVLLNLHSKLGFRLIHPVDLEKSINFTVTDLGGRG